MKRYYYDLHTHSCLSPCADNDNTPANLVGMAVVSGLDIIALTDHNSTKNCPAFFDAAKRHGIIPIAGMELTTAEDIHMVCLFKSLADAMSFGDEIDKRRMKVLNRPDIFGEQLITDVDDNIIGKEEFLLSVATDISVEALPSLVKNYGGICYPAHIDRDANGIISILGTLPESPVFSTVEIRDPKNADKYRSLYGLDKKTIVFNSDAHFLGNINDKEHFVELSGDDGSVVKELIKLLG